MSAAMPWVKLYTEMLDDPKIGKLPDGIKWRFVQLVLLAGECDADGCLINGEMSLTAEEIAWRLRLDPAQVNTDIEHLKKIGLLEQDADGFCVKNFAKRQGRSQEDKRAAWRARQAKKREADDKGGGNEPPPPPVDVPYGPNMSHSLPENVTRDSRVSHASREEESREEESREDCAASAATPNITSTLESSGILQTLGNPKDHLELAMNWQTLRGGDDTVKAIRRKKCDEATKDAVVVFYAALCKHMPHKTPNVTAWIAKCDAFKVAYRGDATIVDRAAALAVERNYPPSTPNGLVWAIDELRGKSAKAVTQPTRRVVKEVINGVEVERIVYEQVTA